MTGEIKDYAPKDWKTGDLIDEGSLDNIEQGVLAATKAVKVLQAAPAPTNGKNGRSVYVATVNISSDTAFPVSNLKAGDGVAVNDILIDTGGNVYTVVAVEGQNVTPSGVVFNIKGPQGDQGVAGTRGTDGAAGANGAQGASMRYGNVAVTADSSNNAFSILTPGNAVIPVRVGDIVLDAEKHVFAVTAINADAQTFSVGKLAGTLP